ncbi:hypothetical protein WBJ53_28440 [Spirosoma sp. SC4-14]|uniref:DUF6934 family protein n=1 Tax=Spirosoma sp. SC4-14 TaxID=3128900 RepID=UPI0030D31344
MQYPSYSFRQADEATQFFFESIGPKGVIQKAVIFSLISEPTVYNLALGDVKPNTAEVDDQSVSDNGDTAVILATIFQITHQFLSANPTFTVLFRGNSASRNRLYRMAINREKEELLSYFSMFGYYHDSWEEFWPNRPYVAFLIRKK